MIEPGDLFVIRKPYSYLKPGDIVEVVRRCSKEEIKEKYRTDPSGPCWLIRNNSGCEREWYLERAMELGLFEPVKARSSNSTSQASSIPLAEPIGIKND